MDNETNNSQMVADKTKIVSLYMAVASFNDDDLIKAFAAWRRDGDPAMIGTAVDTPENDAATLMKYIRLVKSETKTNDGCEADHGFKVGDVVKNKIDFPGKSPMVVIDKTDLANVVCLRMTKTDEIIECKCPAFALELYERPTGV